MMEKFEFVQYSAALAVSGKWKGTSREKFYKNKLGWESLNLRRWNRRIVLFFKIVNNLTPEKKAANSTASTIYRLRRQATIGQIRTITTSFVSSFYPNCLSEWNKLDSEIRQLLTLACLKRSFIHSLVPYPTSLHHSRPERLGNSNTPSGGSE